MADQQSGQSAPVSATPAPQPAQRGGSSRSNNLAGALRSDAGIMGHATIDRGAARRLPFVLAPS